MNSIPYTKFPEKGEMYSHHGYLLTVSHIEFNRNGVFIRVQVGDFSRLGIWKLSDFMNNNKIKSLKHCNSKLWRVLNG